LNVLRIINEPTAAAIAYGIDKKIDKKILVYDLGGGTFDVSLLEIDNGFFEVIATSGDTHLGGEDFDERLTKYLIKKFVAKYGQENDPSNSSKSVQKLRRKAEEVKKQLSSNHQVKVEIESL